MGRVLGVVFCCAILFWVLAFLTPTTQKDRIDNFCSPFSYPVKIIGAAVSSFNEDGGQSIINEGSEATNDYCRDFAPRFLKIIGAGMKDKDILSNQLNVLEEKKRFVVEQMETLNTEAARKQFTQEAIQNMKNELLRQYRELEQQALILQTKPSETGISDEDKL